MLGSGFFALLFAIGVTAWMYSKMSQRTGSSNAKPAIIMSLVVGIIAFIVFFTILKFFLHQ
jgi:uncharacterized protein with PQ loop repeat